MDNAANGIKLKVATLAIRTAEVLIRLKERTVRQELRRATAKLVHVKQVEEAEAGLVEALEPLIRRQVEDTVKRLGTASGDDAAALADAVFDPSEWDEALVKSVFPALARSMGEAALAVFADVGVDVRKSMEKYSPSQPRVPAGSPEGGQWTGGGGGGGGDGGGEPSLPAVQVVPSAVGGASSGASEASRGIVSATNRDAFLQDVTTTPGGKLSLPKESVEAFKRDGNVEHLLGHEGRDGIIAERRARDKFGQEHGGIEIQKDAALRGAFDQSMAATAKLSDAERDAIGSYTMDFDVNDNLREGKKLTKEQKKQVQAIEKLVDETGTWEKSGTVYHGIAVSSKDADGFVAKAQSIIDGKGDWVESGILSTSGDRRMSEEWMQRGGNVGVLMRIKTNKGAVISHLSSLPGQEEVLFKPGTKMRPTKISSEKDAMGTMIRVIDFEAA